MHNLFVAVVEDDPFFREELVRQISAFPGIEIMGSFEKGEDFLHLVHRIEPDILFLDVGLPGISGIQVAKRIREDFPYMDIIFITADENYLRDAFEVYASDYIGKPLNTDRVYKTIKRIEDRLHSARLKITIKCKDSIKIIKQENIYVVEALTKKTLVNCVDDSFICQDSLKKMENRLDHKLFFRSSRSHIVNLSLVESIKPSTRTLYEITFKGKEYCAYLQKEIYPEFRQRMKSICGSYNEKGW